MSLKFSGEVVIAVEESPEGAVLMDYLFCQLSKSYTVANFSQNTLSLLPQKQTSSPLILLTDAKSISLPQSTPLLIIAGETALDFTPSPAVSVILHLQNFNKKRISSLRRQNIPVISCGASGAATVTFSSCTEDRVAVALQRGIENIGGQAVEPMELLLPASPNGLPQHFPLYLAAILLKLT